MFEKKLAINAIEEAYQDGMTPEELTATVEDKIRAEYGSVIAVVLIALLPDLIRWFISLLRRKENENRMDARQPESLAEEKATTGRAKRTKRPRRNS